MKLAAIKIAGLGPHNDTTTTVEPEIARPSEWGKSWLVDAALWCLWGRTRTGATLDGSALRADAAEVRGARWGWVEIDLGGRRVARGLSSGGTIAVKVDGVRVGTDAALAEALGLPDRATALLVWGPMHWTGLTPRALRDALVVALRAEDPEALAAAVRRTVPDYDPAADGATEKAAFAARAAANKRRDEAIGARNEAASRFADLRLQDIAAPTHDAAALDAMSAWYDGERAREAAQRALQAWMDATAGVDPIPSVEEARAAYRATARAEEAADRDMEAPIFVSVPDDLQAQLEEIAAEIERLSHAPEPAGSPEAARIDADADAKEKHTFDATNAAAAARRAAEIRVHDIDALAGGLGVKRRAAEDALADLARECPKCGHEWAASEDESERLQAQLDRALRDIAQLADDRRAAIAQRDEADRLADAADAAHKAALDEVMAMRATAARLRAEARQAAEEARAATRERIAALREEERFIRAKISAAQGEQFAAEQARRAAARRDAYAARERAFAVQTAAMAGARPPDPPARVDPPAGLLGEPQIAVARQRLAQHEALVERHAQDLAAAEARLDAARETATAAAEAADRLDRVVAAVRAAPSVVLREALAAVNDRMTGARLVVDDDGARLLVDERPVSLASHGRRVLADACLRAAIADAAGLDLLPIFIDDASLWSGEWPDDPRFVRLVTRADPPAGAPVQPAQPALFGGAL